MAGATAMTAIYPLETAKTRMAISAEGLYNGIGIGPTLTLTTC